MTDRDHTDGEAAFESRGTTKSHTSLDTHSHKGHRKGSFSYRQLMPERDNNCDIAERYSIGANEIGAGGYGKVFIGTDKHFGQKKVAIKKVPKHMGMADPKKLEALRKEVDIMKELDHPNICKLLETYETPQVMYFVMECCEGGEVFDRIMDAGTISEDKTCNIIRQVASALLYSHKKGIAHRDLKPENICFVSANAVDTQVKVIDWGLGFYFGQGRMSSAVGSLTYAAPEVLEAGHGIAYGAACDLWSLGVLAYVMLSGRPPFWGNHQEQLRNMKAEKFPMRDSPWPSITTDGKAFITSLLKRDPLKRLPIEEVLQHRWFQLSAQDRSTSLNSTQQREVLTNLQQFKKNSVFFSMCITSVARQLDHSSLKDVHKVFSELDINGDGVLTLQEVKDGFARLYGANSPESQQVEEMFEKLDLDGSGTIDYTEFCAAGIGEQMTNQEHVLYAAFKTFDVTDNDGCITKDEIAKVLEKADVQKAWSKEVCQQVAQEIMQKFDVDNSGTLTFDEWLAMMRNTAIDVSVSKAASESLRPSQRGTAEDLIAELERAGQSGNIEEAYQLLKKLNDGALNPSRPSAVRDNQVAVSNPPVLEKRKLGIGGFANRLARTITGNTDTPVCHLNCAVM